MRSTNINIAKKLEIGINLLIDNILLPPPCHTELVSASHSKRKDSDLRQNDICSHAELVSASWPVWKDSDFRQNDVYCHAELVSASWPNGKDSDLHRNDVLHCTDVPWRVSTQAIEF